MACLFIGYDLNREGANYAANNKKLIDRIKDLFPTYWHHLDSTWIVSTGHSVTAVRDDLKQYIDNNDELLVAEIGPRAAWSGFNQSGSDWLKKHL